MSEIHDGRLICFGSRNTTDHPHRIVFGSPEANAIRQRDAILNCEPLPPGPNRADMERELSRLESEIDDLYAEIDELESQAADLRRYLERGPMP